MKLLNFNNLDELTNKIRTEQQAINYFIKLRWGNKIFSYKTGTIFENTKIYQKLHQHTARFCI